MADPSSRRYVALPGSERQPVRGAQISGPVDPAQMVELTIRLRSRAPAGELAARADALGALPPDRRAYLTPEQFAATYGADPADVERVTQFARQSGLAVVRTDVSQRLVVVSGRAPVVAAAFRVELMRYTSPSGDYRGRVGPVQIPEDLQGIIESVHGLDDRPQARAHIVLPDRDRRAALAAAARPLAAGAATPGSFSGAQVGTLYGFPAGLSGAGQTIGILEFGGGFSQGDLQSYFQQLGLPVPRVTAVSADGTANQPGQDQDSDMEVMLDIEVAGSLAPGAQIVVYFAPFTDKGWIDVLAAAVHDTQHRPSVISISWGYTEGQDIWTAQTIQAVNEAFQAAALQGITICAASGDDGSRDEDNDGRAHVDFPASSQYVLACGGTTLQLSSTGLVGETVWNGGASGGSSGGGISDMIALPSWQRGIVPPSVNPDHRVGRGVPDVAGNADGATGYAVLAGGQVLTGVGGTSAVAPLWAALIARINQHLGKPVGYLNPLLYGGLGKTAALRDVTTGNNDPTGRIGGYSARAGWDPCTGWGSPDGTRLLNALAPGSPLPVGSTAEPIATKPGGITAGAGGLLILALAVVVVVIVVLFVNGTL
jgi:kumamolisin